MTGITNTSLVSSVNSSQKLISSICSGTNTESSVCQKRIKYFEIIHHIKRLISKHGMKQKSLLKICLLHLNDPNTSRDTAEKIKEINMKNIRDQRDNPPVKGQILKLDLNSPNHKYPSFLKQLPGLKPFNPSPRKGSYRIKYSNQNTRSFYVSDWRLSSD